MKGLRFSLSHVQVHDWQFFVGPIQSINFHQITPCALLQLVFWPLIAEQTSFYIGRCPGSGTTLKKQMCCFQQFSGRFQAGTTFQNAVSVNRKKPNFRTCHNSRQKLVKAKACPDSCTTGHFFGIKLLRRWDTELRKTPLR